MNSKTIHQQAIARRNKQRAGTWRLDGEHLTYADIAHRLGISVDAARLRMAKLRGASGAITLARLRALGE
jgi:DNA-directed RNA polymerase specialized sigma24 family protein